MVLLVVGYIGLRLWLTAYLRSPGFRELIAGITAKQLKATGDFMPFHFAGTTIYSDAFKAKGSAQAAFSTLDADQIRAEVNLNGLWNHAWEIDEIAIQRLQIAVGKPAPGDAAELPVDTATSPRPQWSWLPNHVDLKKVTVQEVNLAWLQGAPQAGSAENVDVVITPDGDAWNLACQGGTIKQKGQPELTLGMAHLRYQKPSLFITDADLRNGSSGGTITVSGEVDFEKSYEVHAKVANVPVGPFLREDWRAKLKGNLVGDVKVTGPLPYDNAPEVSGSMALVNGDLEALPVLDQIAIFTNTQRFRKLSLSRASADFTHSATKTTVTNLILESEGLIRVEGGCVIENGLIDGTFQVGVTPSSLQWLPAQLQSVVFASSHDGYVWTTMHLTGPVEHPNEDLTQRLVSAAGGQVIDTVKGVIQQVPGSDQIPGKIDEGKQIINGLLSPLMGK